MTEKRLEKLEAKVDALIEMTISANKEIAQLMSSVEKIFVMTEDIAVIKANLSNITDDVSKSFDEISQVKTKGIGLCEVHKEQIRQLCREVNSIKSKAWQIYLLFVGQLLQLWWMIKK